MLIVAFFDLGACCKHFVQGGGCVSQRAKVVGPTLSGVLPT